MDRQLIYAGQVPLDSDLLNAQVNMMEAVGYALRAAFGTTTFLDGLAVAPTSPASMSLTVGPGSITALAVTDASAYGSLASNSNPLMKMGINYTSTTLAFVAPATSGQSQNFLIEAAFSEADSNALALPYFNASNPTISWSGPNNSGTPQNTQRQQRVSIQVKPGAAAPSGSQTTPSPDSGWTGLAVVTIANGATSLTAANVTQYGAAPVVPTKLMAQRTRLFNNLALYVSPYGSDTQNSGLSANVPLATINAAWTLLANNYDLNGYAATIYLANGTYTAFAPSAPIVGTAGSSSVTIYGNPGSSSTVAISGGASSAVTNQVGAQLNMQGVTLSSTGGHAIYVASGTVTFANCTFAGVNTSGFSHMVATGAGSTILATGPYSVTGSAGSHIQASLGAIVGIAAQTVTISGTPAFTFAFANQCGQVQANGCTFTGAQTGQKYLAASNAVINTNGAAVSYLPGSVAGTTSTGGQYV